MYTPSVKMYYGRGRLFVKSSGLIPCVTTESGPTAIATGCPAVHPPDLRTLNLQCSIIPHKAASKTQNDKPGFDISAADLVMRGHRCNWPFLGLTLS